VRAILGLDGFHLLKTLGIEDGDDPRRADRHVQPVAALVVHDGVRGATKRQSLQDAAAVRDALVDDNELATVGGTEEPAIDEREPVGALGADVDAARLHQQARVDREDHGRTLDGHVHLVTRAIEDRPARPARKPDGPDDASLIDGHDGSTAACSGRLAEVEAVQMAPAGIERETVRPRPDVDLCKQRFVRAAEDAHPSRGAIGGEQEIPPAVDEHAGDARQVGQRAKVGIAAAVDHVDGVRCRMCDIQATARRLEVRVSVVEAGALATRERDEARQSQAQTGLASTRFWQKA